MDNLLVVFDCPKCGKVLADEIIVGEETDYDRDDMFERRICAKCKSDVTPRTYKQEHGGISVCYEEVDEERAKWANGFYDDIIKQS